MPGVERNEHLACSTDVRLERFKRTIAIEDGQRIAGKSFKVTGQKEDSPEGLDGSSFDGFQGQQSQMSFR